MSPILEWLNNSLESIEHKIFKDVVKAEDAETKPLGDGQVVMISDVKRIILNLKTKSGQKKQLKAIIKVEIESGVAKNFAANCDAFTTEIMMYSDVLKSMEELMSEVGRNDYPWAECYHCGDNKILIQDLCEVGYSVVPVYTFLDLDHALMVMKALGEFHSLSMVMKERNTIKIENFNVPYYARKLPLMDTMQKQLLENLVKTMKEKWGAEWSSIGDRLMKYLEKPGEMMYNAWESTKGKWDVLNHGDFTIRNMLFHYTSDSTKPDGIKFVDFQMCHYSSLANDLVTLLYTSILPPVREKNIKLLVETYINSLISTTNLYGYKGPLPTVQDVQSTIRLLSPIIVINSIMTIPFFIRAGKEDIQKKTDEYFEKYGNNDGIDNELPPPDFLGHFEDKDAVELLQFELNRFVKDNIF